MTGNVGDVPEDVLIETVGAVATIRLNRGAKRNALTTAMYARLADGLTTLAADSTVRVIVLTGSDGSFTAGNDLRDMAEAGDLDENSPPRRFLDALVAAPQVLVIGVAGAAIGIGTSVILHADLVYASASSIFALPFVPLGLVPEAASTLLLPAVIGHVRAAELLLLGGRFDAAQAERWGLVNEVLDGGQAELDAHLAVVTARLAAQPAESLLQTRRLLRAHRRDAVGIRLQEDAMIMRELAAGLPR
jgi:enoyl-CoA hydratase/carnithine racemase